MIQAASTFTASDIAAEGPDALQSLVDNAVAAVGGIGILVLSYKAECIVASWREALIDAEDACPMVFAIIGEIYAIGSSRAFWAARRENGAVAA
ncbi:MAG: hypothetical protein KGR68_09815 [Betaproteobacteria bacterium]|nr:hypothetical protein [Betaproteobacteria bacterium]